LLVDKSKPVVVTGATGYVAGALVAELLALGLTVHACVRDTANTERLKYLHDLASKTEGTLRFFEADLLVPGSYEASMQGASVVFHTASPFILEVNDAQRDLVDPALKGSLNVLQAVANSPSVKRVVLTSSVAAMASDNIEVAQNPKGFLSEDDWNEYASVDYNPYHYSKTVAEQAAWQFVQSQEHWDLVVINPSLVVGPALNPQATSDSFNLIGQFADGTMKWGAPECGIGLVSVTDVAHAHVLAAFKAEASGRYIISAKDSSIMDMANMLRARFGDDYPLPKTYAPKFLAWLFAPFAGTTRLFVKRNFGYAWRASREKSINELGLQYQNPAEPLNAMFQQYVDSGRLH
jgi:dihydroflavonol-4-reductase